MLCAEGRRHEEPRDRARGQVRETAKRDSQMPRPMKLNMNDANRATCGGIWNSRPPVARPNRMM